MILEVGYPAAHHDRFIRDHLVFEMKSESVRNECLKVGNQLTLRKARELAKADESASKQLQSVSETDGVNILGTRKMFTLRNTTKSEQNQK